MFHLTFSMMHGNTKLKFIDPCIANIFAEYNQQDATFHNLFISVRRCTCFRRVFRPSSGVQNCTYRVRPILLPAASLVRLASSSNMYSYSCMISLFIFMEVKHDYVCLVLPKHVAVGITVIRCCVRTVCRNVTN